MACCKSKHFVDKTLRKFFYWLGFNIGLRPGYFILVPILLTALLATGFQQMDYNYDPEYLFSPSHGMAKHERATVEKYFPTNFSDFRASRITRPGKFGRVIVTARDGGSMLRTHLWDQLLYLDKVIYNVTVEHEGHQLHYAELCAQWNQYCYDNEILRIASVLPSIESGEIKMTYPFFFDPVTFESYALPIFFGGTKLNEDQVTVQSVEAVGLSYFLDVSEDWLVNVGDHWERQFLIDIEANEEEFYPDLIVGMFVSNTPAWEMEKSKLSVTFLLCINVGLLVVFSFVSTLMGDAAKSKPLVGFSGLFSACLATLAGFGFCCYIQVEWISLTLAAPFLLFGIGFDDTFVMLSAWRRTPSHLSVPERMGRTYEDAGVSITFTSLTNICSCLAGAMTPFPCIKIFCIYTGVAMTFTYVWHITMFGGFLALAGRAEAKNKHGMFVCHTVTPKSLAKNRSWFYRAFMTGGLNPDDPLNPIDNQEHAGMAFFRDYLGNWLNIGWVKAVILTVFVGYLIAGIWGVTEIREGLEKRNTANYDSYSVLYYDLDDRYFKEYAFTIGVVISGPHLDFSNPDTQKEIETITKALEDSVYINANFTQNWMRDFLDYVDRNKGYSDVHLPIASEAEFANTLKNIYLADSNNPARLDVAFSDDGSRVDAARFLIQGHHINNSLVEQLMVAELREICARYSTDELQVTVFQPFFIYIDQYLAILPQTLQTIFVTAGIMVIISLLLIPNFMCALWVSFSIVSIEIGVVGYMAWWGIRLDGVALINLIMCIGFSVDFSAHICYHYLTAVSEDEDSVVVENNISLTGRPEDRIKASLYALGIPILQGASSTIIGVLGLAFSPSYLFVTFFKMIFLVIMLGTFHGMVLLPVLLSLMGPGSCTNWSKIDKEKAISSKSTRSSGLSTPTLNAISCHKKGSSIDHDNGYTINLAYVARDEPSQFGPYQYHQQSSFPYQSYAMQRSLPCHPEVNTSPEQSSPATSTSSSSGGQRLRKGHIVQQQQRQPHHHRKHYHHHHRHHHHQVHVHPGGHVNGRQMVAALNVNGYNTSTPDQHRLKKTAPVTKTRAAAAETKLQSEHDRQLDLHLAAISRIQQRSSQKTSCNHHKKVGRSRSHRPRLTSEAVVSTIPEGVRKGLPVMSPSNFAEKPALRKHHSFPYETFNNETSYSSDDSISQNQPPPR